MGTASSMPIQKLDRWHWPLANKPHLKSKKGGRTRSAHSSAYYKRKLVLLLLRFPAASSSYSPTSTRLLQTATSLSIHPLVLLRLGILSRDTQQVCHKSLERQTRGAPMYGSPPPLGLNRDQSWEMEACSRSSMWVSGRDLISCVTTATS